MTTYNLADLWETLTDAGPDMECLVINDRRHTRRSWDEAANRLGHALQERGVARGDHVGILSHNRIEFMEAMLACWKIGAVPVNLNYRYVAEELRYVLGDADLVAMIAERTFVPVLDEIATDVPSLTTYLLIDDGAAHQPAHFAADSYDDALAAASSERGFGVERSADDLYLLYTGGTTGMPKGVMWRHEDIFFASFGGGNYYDPITSPAQIAVNATEPGLRMDALALAPLMHGGGQWITFIGLYSGGKAVVYGLPSFDAERVLELIDREKPMTTAMVGDAMARPIAEAKLASGDRYDTSSLLNLGNGGAMLSRQVRAQLVEAFPGAIVTDSFGSTETGSAGVQVEQEGYTEGPKFSINADTAVLDPATLEPSPVGERGMLARSGHIPLGYYNDPVKTAETFKTDARGRRWVIPGDWAAIEPDGRMVLYGRGSVSINSGGEKIYPEEVESAVRSHPAVYDAVVCGIPDERWGQKVVALVELRPQAESIDLESLQQHCRIFIAGYKVPREIVIGPVQRTNVGKADYVWAKERAALALGTEG